MQDYITRAEFEELKEMLLCRGDGQTIAVDHTPGGQVVSGLYPLPEEAEEAVIPDDYDFNDITATYSSGTSSWTFAFNNIRFNVFGPELRPRYYLLVSQSIILDHSGGSQIQFYADQTPTTGSTVTRFMWSNATTSDADSLLLQTNNTKATKVGVFDIPNFPSDGQVIRPGDVDGFGDLIFSGSMTDTFTIPVPYPGAYVRTDLNQIVYKTLFHNYTGELPLDTTIIFGWNNGDSAVTLDISPNLGDYDDYRIVGYVKIDASENVYWCYLYDFDTSPVGYTGTANSTNTLTILDGKITNVT